MWTKESNKNLYVLLLLIPIGGSGLTFKKRTDQRRTQPFDAICLQTDKDIPAFMPGIPTWSRRSEQTDRLSNDELSLSWTCASEFEKFLRSAGMDLISGNFYSRACDSTPRFVGRSVGRSVTLYFCYDFYFWTSPLLPKWSSDLKYGPCPPARDFGSRVSGLVLKLISTTSLV